MDYCIYLLFRAFTALVLSLPLIAVYRLGQAFGFLGWLLFFPYRRLVKANLTIAYGGVAVCREGVAVEHDSAAVTTHLDGSLIDIHCQLGLADGDGVVMGVDLGYGYIDENRTTS